MIKKIFKKFHIMLFIPILMILSLFIFNQEDNSVLLEYHPPREIFIADIVSYNNYDVDRKRMLSMVNFESSFDEVIIDLEEVIEDAIIEIEETVVEVKEVVKETENVIVEKVSEPVVEYVTHENSIYFTDEQLARLPNNYTVEDLRLICTMVYGECGAITGDVLITYYDEYNNPGESFYIDASYMHKLTASVLCNRVKHESFPNTIYGNLVKKNQYTELYTYESQSYKYYSEVGSNWYNVVNDVLEVLNEEFDIPDDVIFQSNFSNLGSRYFASIYVNTGWFRSMSYYAYD